jgi:hypothetical protein
MSAHGDCYGTMLPDFRRLEKHLALRSPAFTALVESQGIGMQRRKLEVDPGSWEKCVACADYRTCYDLSQAKLLMNAVLVNGWYGA